MTTKTERLAAMHESALASIANELGDIVSNEIAKGSLALETKDFRATDYHNARATAFLAATRVIYRVISEIENEVNRDDTGN